MSLADDWDSAKPVANLQADWDKATPLAAAPATKRPAEGPPAAPKGLMDDASTAYHGAMESITDPIKTLASSAFAGPFSHIAGLGAAAYEGIRGKPEEQEPRLGATPQGFQQALQQSMTHEPTTAAGRVAAMPGRAFGWATGKVGDFIKGDNPDPWREAAGNLVQSGLEQAPGFLGAKGSAMLKERIPAKQAALNVQKGLDAPLNEIRERSQAAGLTTPPEGTSWMAGIPGMAKTDRWISAENQPKFNQIVADQFKLPKGVALSKEVLANIRSKAGKSYDDLVQSGYGEEVTEKQAPKVSTSRIIDERGKPYETVTPQPDVTRIPGLKLEGEFKAPLQSALQTIVGKIEEAPQTFRSLRQSAALLREWIKKDEVDPQAAMEGIKQLRADAQTSFKSTKPADRQAAFTRQEIADRLEDAFERNLEQSGNTKLLDKFREARKTIAMSYAVEKVIDRAGNVNAQKLAALGERRPLTENLKLVSDFAAQFPEGARKVTAGKQAISPFDWMFMIASGPLRGGLEIAGRAGVPWLAGKGLLSKHTPKLSGKHAAERSAACRDVPATAATAAAVTPERKREIYRQWRARNPERAKELARKSVEKHKEKRAAETKAWREKHPERVKELRIAWKLKNPARKAELNRLSIQRHPDRHCARIRRRHAARKRAIPAWFDRFLVCEVYHLARLRKEHCGGDWHVDHIVPLRSAIVCGLHVQDNLRVIPALENRKKANTFWPDMP